MIMYIYLSLNIHITYAYSILQSFAFLHWPVSKDGRGTFQISFSKPFTQIKGLVWETCCVPVCLT